MQIKFDSTADTCLCFQIEHDLADNETNAQSEYISNRVTLKCQFDIKLIVGLPHDPQSLRKRENESIESEFNPDSRFIIHCRSNIKY